MAKEIEAKGFIEIPQSELDSYRKARASATAHSAEADAIKASWQLRGLLPAESPETVGRWIVHNGNKIESGKVSVRFSPACVREVKAFYATRIS